MRNLIIKTATAVFVLAALAAPPVASAQTKSDGSSSTTASDTNTTDQNGTSEFEQTRKHMIEMNKESQRTGKM